jgi:transcriptional regulator with XRE-family HTH domain
MSQALDDRDLGAVLTIYRRWTGATQPQIAAMTGVPQPTVSVIVNGKREVISLKMFERFAQGLGIPRHRLGLAEPPAADPPQPPPPAEPDRRTVLAAGVALAVDEENAGRTRNTPDAGAGSTLLGAETWTREDADDLARMLEAGADAPVPDAATAARLAHEWLVAEPPQIVEVRAGRRIGEGLARKIEGRVAQLRRMDDFIGG